MTGQVRRRRVSIGAAVLFSGCMSLAACSSGPSSAANSAARAPRTDLGAVRAAPAAATGHGAGSGALSGSGLPNRRGVQTAGLIRASQSIIYTARVTMRSADVAAAAKHAIAIVVGAGGYTADEQVSGKTPGKSSEQTVSLTLKVPVISYQSVLVRLSAPTLGKQLGMQQHATDVTQHIADVNSLVISEQDAIAALRGLLKRAASVSGLLQVQQQISQDQSYLNSLLSQQRALNQETSYATITMRLLSVKFATHHTVALKKHGFLAGLAAGWRTLRHATAWALTALGAILPFLILVLVLGVIGYLVWRRFGGRRAMPTQPTDAAG